MSRMDGAQWENELCDRNAFKCQPLYHGTTSSCVQWLCLSRAVAAAVEVRMMLLVPYPSSENCSVTFSVLILLDLSTCNSLLSLHFRLLASFSGASFLLLDSGQQTPALSRVERETSNGKICAEAAVIEL